MILLLIIFRYATRQRLRSAYAASVVGSVATVCSARGVVLLCGSNERIWRGMLSHSLCVQ